MGVGVGLPSGTVTFLFTDIEGSTHLWESFPDAMGVALARHDEILRSAIEAHSGYVFATGGDGFCAAFAGASDAVDAAVEAQRGLGVEVWPAGCVLAARMGVHSGEAEERGGDYFGSTVNRVGRLHAVGHGGQIVVSATTEPLVREHVELSDLGRFRLRDFDDPASVFQVVADGLATDFPVLRTLDTFAHNLPSMVDEFVGRDTEVRELTESLRASRIVTLTGVGGTGKTRLAVEAAATVVDRFTDGVWLVELAPVIEPAAVPFVIGDAVGAVQQDGLTMAESLVRSLAPRNVLLVLDNCEHLLDDVAELVSMLVAKCPKLVVLATSREGLAVRGEQIVATPSLATDESVELFTARAAASGATIDGTNRGDVVGVVERLDGLPLAIELAAARTNALSVAEIGERLDDRFRLLRGGGRGRRERHQTLWNTVAWSYDLLSETEQAIFGRLSVFAGGFTIDAAQGVCAPEFDEFDVEDAIIAFVERSLLVAESTSVGTRYEMLETLRQFGEAQLDDTTTGAIRARHAAWYADYAEQAYMGVMTDDAIAWNRRGIAETDNYRIVVYGADADAACRVVAAQQWVWWLRLDYEIVDWALRLLEHHNTETEQRALALVQGLAAAKMTGRHADTARLENALDATELDGLAQLWWLQQKSYGGEEIDRPFYLRCALSLDIVNERAVWVVTVFRRIVLAGDLVAARQFWEQHGEVIAGNRSPTAQANHLFYHGLLLAATNEPGARGKFERAAEIWDRLDWPLMYQVAFAEIARLQATEGEFSEARRKLADVILTWTRAGELIQLTAALHYLTEVLVLEGNTELAHEIWVPLQNRYGGTPALRAELLERLGDPDGPEMTDNEFLSWATDLATRIPS